MLVLLFRFSDTAFNAHFFWQYCSSLLNYFHFHSLFWSRILLFHACFYFCLYFDNMSVFLLFRAFTVKDRKFMIMMFTFLVAYFGGFIFWQERQLKVEEYRDLASSLLRWLSDVTVFMQNRTFPATKMEMRVMIIILLYILHILLSYTIRVP